MGAAISHRLGKMFRVMARIYNKALEPLEISSVQAHILATLWLDGPMTIGELQSRLLLGSSTLTGAVDRMEKRGLCKRTDAPGDRRAFLLAPVEWPARKKEALRETLAATEEDCFRALTAAERKELARLLGKALSIYEDADE